MPTAQRHNNKKNFLAKSNNNIAISSRNLRTSTILFDEIKVVVCPAFAESITEGDLRWEKAAGDAVAEDEVKLEIQGILGRPGTPRDDIPGLMHFGD